MRKQTTQNEGEFLKYLTSVMIMKNKFLPMIKNYHRSGTLRTYDDKIYLSNENEH